jgi:hypothetical protein
MTDSPSGNYQNNTNSWSRTAAAINLTGMNECRLQYYLWLSTEQGFDGIFVEASTNGTTWSEIAAWTGSSGGWVWQDEDLSAFDGLPSVYVRYRLFSDGSVTRDGAYVDEVAVRCTPSAYTGTEYALMDGTSMASPHVAGAAALASAWMPSASAAEVRSALLQGVDAKPGLAGLVATGGRLNVNRTLERVSVIAAPHQRPLSAGKLRVSLVPAFTACTAPNRTHGPPLVGGSCSPPVGRSAQLVVGSSSIGSLRMTVEEGDPDVPADDADVRLAVSISDVRRSSNQADYVGELEARTTLRRTDRLTGPEQDSGTVADVSFEFVVPCAGTSAPGVGSNCVASTTADAVAPGIVAEGSRAVWELGQATLADGGVDGAAGTEPNGVFAVQGLFVP